MHLWAGEAKRRFVLLRILTLDDLIACLSIKNCTRCSAESSLHRSFYEASIENVRLCAQRNDVRSAR